VNFKKIGKKGIGEEMVGGAALTLEQKRSTNMETEINDKMHLERKGRRGGKKTKERTEVEVWGT